MNYIILAIVAAISTSQNHGVLYQRVCGKAQINLLQISAHKSARKRILKSGQRSIRLEKKNWLRTFSTPRIEISKSTILHICMPVN